MIGGSKNKRTFPKPLTALVQTRSAQQNIYWSVATDASVNILNMGSLSFWFKFSLLLVCLFVFHFCAASTWWCVFLFVFVSVFVFGSGVGWGGGAENGRKWPVIKCQRVLKSERHPQNGGSACAETQVVRGAPPTTRKTQEGGVSESKRASGCEGNWVSTLSG